MEVAVDDPIGPPYSKLPSDIKSGQYGAVTFKHGVIRS